MANPLRFNHADPIIVPAKGMHTATVIFVHGSGGHGSNFQGYAEAYGAKPTLNHIKWVLPHAKTRPFTIGNGMLIPIWFDILDMDLSSLNQDQVGILESAEYLSRLICAEIDAGIPSERVVLGGFSQGGTMSLFTGLTTSMKLAGIAILSGRLVIREKLKETVNNHAASLPIFWGHGDEDRTVSHDLGVQADKFLKSELGIKNANSSAGRLPVGVTFKTYRGMGHSIDNEELRDLQAWLEAVLPPRT